MIVSIYNIKSTVLYILYIDTIIRKTFYGFIDKISNSCGLTDRPDMTLDVNRGRKTTTMQQQQQQICKGQI